MNTLFSVNEEKTVGDYIILLDLSPHEQDFCKTATVSQLNDSAEVVFETCACVCEADVVLGAHHFPAFSHFYDRLIGSSVSFPAIMLLHVLYLSAFCAFPLCVRGCERVALIVYQCGFVCVYIFPAALPPGMQHGSSEGDISADRRASFPSPLPSGVALNIKLFNLIQFPTTNTPDWIQMPAASGPTPGLL